MRPRADAAAVVPQSFAVARRRGRASCSPQLEAMLELDGTVAEPTAYRRAVLDLAEALEADVGWRRHRDALLEYLLDALRAYLEHDTQGQQRWDVLTILACDRHYMAGRLRTAADRWPEGQVNFASYWKTWLLWATRDGHHRSQRWSELHRQLEEGLELRVGTSGRRSEAVVYLRQTIERASSDRPELLAAVTSVAQGESIAVAARNSGVSRQQLYRFRNQARSA